MRAIVREELGLGAVARVADLEAERRLVGDLREQLAAERKANQIMLLRVQAEEQNNSIIESLRKQNAVLLREREIESLPARLSELRVRIREECGEEFEALREIFDLVAEVEMFVPEKKVTHELGRNRGVRCGCGETAEHSGSPECGEDASKWYCTGCGALCGDGPGDTPPDVDTKNTEAT